MDGRNSLRHHIGAMVETRTFVGIYRETIVCWHLSKLVFVGIYRETIPFVGLIETSVCWYLWGNHNVCWY